MSSGRLQKVGANASWLIGIRIFRLVVGVIVLGAVGRYLGPEQFGVLNYAIALTAIFGVFATLGMDGIIIRELVNRPNETHHVMGTAFVLRLLGAVAAMILVLSASLVSRDNGQIVTLALFVSLCFIPGSLEVIELWFQKNIMARHTAVARILATLLISGARLALVYYQAPLEYFALMQAVDTLCGGLALMVAFRGRGQPISTWRFKGEIARTLLRDSWPLIASGFLVAIYMRVEQVLVKNVLGDYAVGIYFSATRITEVWSFVPAALLTTLYPVLVAKRREVPDKYQLHLQTVFDLLTGLGYLIAMGMTLLGPVAIPQIFGEKYREAIPILIIQAWAAPILCSALTRAQVMLLENRTIYHTPIALMGIALNIPLALWLMQIYGAKGAALAVLVTSLLTGFLTSFLFSGLRASAIKQTRAFLLPLRLRKVYRTIKELK
jgi:O-antigen/teichoic acid export membrane protein